MNARKYLDRVAGRLLLKLTAEGRIKMVLARYSWVCKDALSSSLFLFLLFFQPFFPPSLSSSLWPTPGFQSPSCHFPGNVTTTCWRDNKFRSFLSRPTLWHSPYPPNIFHSTPRPSFIAALAGVFPSVLFVLRYFPIKYFSSWSSRLECNAVTRFAWQSRLVFLMLRAIPVLYNSQQSTILR